MLNEGNENCLETRQLNITLLNHAARVLIFFSTINIKC